MKRRDILTFVTGVGLLLSGSSCSDYFDVDLGDKVPTDDAYQNLNDVNAVSNGIYAAIASDVHKLFLWGSARGDLVLEGEGRDAYVSEFVRNRVTPENPYTDYGFLYNAIARCNHQLANLPKMKPDGDLLRAEHWFVFYGEAYFIRAWSYFMLVRTFGAVPLVTEEMSDVVIYTDESGNEVKNSTIKMTDAELRAVALKPKAEREIWMQVVSDLAKAMDMFYTYSRYYPGWGDTEGNYSWWSMRANMYAAYTLAADVSLWLKEYERASAFADYVVQKDKIGTSSTWYQQYLSINNTGMAASYNSFGMLYQYSGGFLNTQRMQEFTSPVEEDGGRYLVKPAVGPLTAIFTEENDVRRGVTWMRVGRYDAIWKYIGLDQEGKSMREPYRSDAFYYLIKHLEAYSIKGIAECRRGNSEAAFKMLNLIRHARGMWEYKEEDINMDVKNLENLLFLERARECAFEGKRWYDLLLRETVFQESGIIAETVSEKFSGAEREEMKTRLSNPDSWYLPVDPERWK